MSRVILNVTMTDNMSGNTPRNAALASAEFFDEIFASVMVKTQGFRTI